MRNRERQHEGRPTPGDPGIENRSETLSADFCRCGDDLFAAVDEALVKALSQDSQCFLRACRQHVPQ